jgi:hypothetical protein
MPKSGSVPTAWWAQQRGRLAAADLRAEVGGVLLQAEDELASINMMEQKNAI